MSALPGRTGATARGERCWKARRQLDLPERARAKQVLGCDGKGGKRRFVRVRLQRLVSLHLVVSDRVPSLGVANGLSVRRSRAVLDGSGSQIRQSDKRIIRGGRCRRPQMSCGNGGGDEGRYAGPPPSRLA